MLRIKLCSFQRASSSLNHSAISPVLYILFYNLYHKNLDSKFGSQLHISCVKISVLIVILNCITKQPILNKKKSILLIKFIHALRTHTLLVHKKGVIFVAWCFMSTRMKHAWITKSKSTQGWSKVLEGGSVIRLQPWKGLVMFGQDLAMNNWRHKSEVILYTQTLPLKWIPIKWEWTTDNFDCKEEGKRIEPFKCKELKSVSYRQKRILLLTVKPAHAADRQC